MEQLRNDLEKIISDRLAGMPNYEEYMINATMRVLVVNDIIAYLNMKAELPSGKTL